VAEGPIQVVLDTDRFKTVRVRQGGGRNKDFFANQDEHFAAHRSRLLDQARGAVAGLLQQAQTSVGVAKVILRTDALAKSHRPNRALFTGDRTPIVGNLDFGQLLFRVTPSSLAEVVRAIEEAEPETRWKEEKDGKPKPNPTRNRSEAGAIERIELYGASDKRAFSAVQAIEWLQDPRTGGTYLVDLFQTLIPRDAWDRLEEEDLSLQRTFIEGVEALRLPLQIVPVDGQWNARTTLAIRLAPEGSPGGIFYNHPIKPSSALGNATAPGIETEAAPHDRLLDFLDHHPLVRNVRLPGKLKSTQNPVGRAGEMVAIPNRVEGRSYPRMGIIDGGASASLAPWIVGAWDFLAAEHQDLTHGTFIGGLAVVGEPLNGLEVVVEPGACDLIDIAVAPREDQPHLFQDYFPNGLVGFFDEVEAAIQACKARYGVRIFNFSMNVEVPAGTSHYSQEAARLDEIADRHDVLICVSAGNLHGSQAAKEWPKKATDALAYLAGRREDRMFVPAESVRNLTVGAINPPALAQTVGHAPASYTRRGPGLAAIVKPDLVHVGGAGTPRGLEEHGLFSLTPEGRAVSNCGTSFAAPLVAKAAAVLDQSIEGEVSRETLKALLIHGAIIPGPLQHRAFRSVARDLVGFGLPRPAQEILEGNPHEITLVFANRLQYKQELIFDFQWPRCLVGANGECTGDIRATLVYTPPLDYRFGAEFVRINLDAHLRQEDGNGVYASVVPPAYLPVLAEKGHHYEATQVEHGMKWSPVKIYRRPAKAGGGCSSNWRLVLSYLERSESKMPDGGVPFTCIVTIADPSATKPVFNEVRQNLQTIGVRIANIQTAARITARV